MLMNELQRIITIHLLIYYNRWTITAVGLLYYAKLKKNLKQTCAKYVWE